MRPVAYSTPGSGANTDTMVMTSSNFPAGSTVVDESCSPYPATVTWIRYQPKIRYTTDCEIWMAWMRPGGMVFDVVDNIPELIRTPASEVLAVKLKLVLTRANAVMQATKAVTATKMTTSSMTEVITEFSESMHNHTKKLTDVAETRPVPTPPYDTETNADPTTRENGIVSRSRGGVFGAAAGCCEAGPRVPEVGTSVGTP